MNRSNEKGENNFNLLNYFSIYLNDFTFEQSFLLARRE